MPPTLLLLCQADQPGQPCENTVCFAAHLDRITDTACPRVHTLQACADHLGDIVQALTEQARKQRVCPARVIVQAIDPTTDPTLPSTGKISASVTFSTLRLTA
jgi:hypothetical protein